MARVAAMRVVAALIAALALFAGCGDDEETTTTDMTATPTATGPTGQEAKPVGPPLEKREREDAPGDRPSGSPGSTPRVALEAFFTSGDPDLVCGELATEDLLSTAYGDEKGCRQAQVPAAIPDSIDIKVVEVTGDEAVATVIPDGGPNDAIETEVVLLNENGAWLVDSLEADVPAGP